MGRIILPGDPEWNVSQKDAVKVSSSIDLKNQSPKNKNNDDVVRISINGEISTERIDASSFHNKLPIRRRSTSFSTIGLLALFASYLLLSAAFTISYIGLGCRWELEHSRNFVSGFVGCLMDESTLMLIGYLISPVSMTICQLLSSVDCRNSQAIMLFMGTTIASFVISNWLATGSFEVFGTLAPLLPWFGIYWAVINYGHRLDSIRSMRN